MAFSNSRSTVSGRRPERTKRTASELWTKGPPGGPTGPDDIHRLREVSPTGATAAGRHGLGLLSIGAPSAGGFNALGSNWAICEDTAKDNGKTADRSQWRLVGPLHIAETREKARENVRFGLEQWLCYFREVAALPLAPTDGSDPVDALIASGMAVVGRRVAQHVEKKGTENIRPEILAAMGLDKKTDAAE
ncbi:MAG: hypothetical protein H5U13_02845 [Parvibaculum sp.]|nr:hypothetical protein [Parvibaculum sp.]